MKIIGSQNLFLIILFFRPTRHIPPTNPTHDLNISPVESQTFVVCRSMQNIQSLTHSNGCNKYVVKYLGKIDEQNFVITSTDSRNGDLKSLHNFRYNSKIASSAMNDKKAIEKRRDKSHPRGRAISQNEMQHHMLGYQEVTTNMTFVGFLRCLLN